MKQVELHDNDTSKLGRRRALGLAAVVFVVVVAVVIAVRWQPKPDEKRGNDPQPPAEVNEGTLPADMGPSWSALDNPAADGWKSEVFSANANKVLKKLSALMEDPAKVNAEQLAPLLSASFSCRQLLPAVRRSAFRGNTFNVERATPVAEGNAGVVPGNFLGPSGFANAIGALAEPLKQATRLHCSFKVFRIVPGPDSVTTLQYVTLTGHTPRGTIEQHATWKIQWHSTDAPNALPEISGIDVTEFEQVRTTHDRGTLFADCTESILGRNESYREQMLRGMNDWFERIQDKRYYYLLGNPGLAIGDVNGDGLDDLYVCQEEGLPNRLYLQQENGTAIDASAEWGVDWLHSSRGALLVDLDNDGDQDLAVATVGHLIVAENTGRSFRVKNILPADQDTMSLSAADYDSDGDLDLFVCAYFASGRNKSDVRGRILAGVADEGIALLGGRNTLFRNDRTSNGTWRFSDVTKASGLDVENRRYSFAASWEDYDRDGDPDLYIVNDYGRNNLFRNDAGRFTDVTLTTGAQDDAFGMAVTWGDYDRDGLMDLHVSNMFSSAGGRVTHSGRLQNVRASWKNKLRRSARGNTLLRNTGTGKFIDVTDRSGIAVGRWAWSSKFVDVNNDGWEDLIVANGFLTTDDTGDL